MDSEFLEYNVKDQELPQSDLKSGKGVLQLLNSTPWHNDNLCQDN